MIERLSLFGQLSFDISTSSELSPVRISSIKYERDRTTNNNNCNSTGKIEPKKRGVNLQHLQPIPEKDEDSEEESLQKSCLDWESTNLSIDYTKEKSSTHEGDKVRNHLLKKNGEGRGMSFFFF